MIQAWIGCLLALCTGGQPDDDARKNVQQAFDRLETIRSARYRMESFAYEPGDSVPASHYESLDYEWVNPKDTVMNAAMLYCDPDGQVRNAYDGERQVNIDTLRREARIKVYPAGVRRSIQAPFHNYVRSILRYALTSGDSLQLAWDTADSTAHMKLIICNPEGQIEFDGRPYNMHNARPGYDHRSIYEVWFDRRSKLPFRVRRTMTHQISEKRCSDFAYNIPEQMLPDITAYIPEGYARPGADAIRSAREAFRKGWEGRPAPSWTLSDIDGREVKLSDFKGRVLLLEFTGIGCGPCAASIPFLNRLRQTFPAETLDVVAIEYWKHPASSLRNYARRHNLGYPFCVGTGQVAKDYRLPGSAPIFFVLDASHTVRKVFNGYSAETAKELESLIRRLSAE